VDADAGESDGRKRLAEGRIYTIRKVSADYQAAFWKRHPRFNGGPVVWLYEVQDRVLGDAPYNARRFRPVVERKTDISIFKAMLNPSDVRETV
jgi:hypothetical protein